MNVTIIPPDDRVCIDGVWRTVPVQDFPHVNAIRFDGIIGTVEHRLHAGEWLPPRVLTADEFHAEFGAILEAYQAAPDDAAPVLVTPEAQALLADFDPAKATLPQIAEILAKLGGKA